MIDSTNRFRDDILKVVLNKKSRLFISFKRPDDGSILHVAVAQDSLQDSILRDILLAQDGSEVCEVIAQNNFEECAEKLVKCYAEDEKAFDSFYRRDIPLFRSKKKGVRFIWLICSDTTFLVFEDDRQTFKDLFVKICERRKDDGMYVVGEIDTWSTLRILKDSYCDESKRSYKFVQEIILNENWDLI